MQLLIMVQNVFQCLLAIVVKHISGL